MRTGRPAKGFWHYVQKTGTCWLWTGARSHDGYGRKNVPPTNREMRAHRIAWCLRYGEPPKDMLVCHKCDTPLCVNPDHLFLGTNADNIRDRDAKGRQNNGRTTQTHCKRGHPLSGGNVHLSRAGSRVCRACDNLRERNR